MLLRKFALICFAFCLIISCTKSPKDSIVGMWKFHKMDIESIAEKEGRVLTEKDRKQIESIEGLMKLTRLEFFQDLTYTEGIKDIPNTRTRGVYSLENDGKSLVMEEQESGDGRPRNKTKRYEVIKIDDKSMVLNMDGVDMEYRKIKKSEEEEEE